MSLSLDVSLTFSPVNKQLTNCNATAYIIVVRKCTLLRFTKRVRNFANHTYFSCSAVILSDLPFNKHHKKCGTLKSTKTKQWYGFHWVLPTKRIWLSIDQSVFGALNASSLRISTNGNCGTLNVTESKTCSLIVSVVYCYKVGIDYFRTCCYLVIVNLSA